MGYRVDLRSDTVTRPSEAMRRAMAGAEVGDDWYGDDPTVNLLQERAAEATGKEAAIFVPTGTMANQIGLRLHFRGTGHLILCEANAHVATVEVMTAAVFAGIAYRTITAGPRGLTAELVTKGLEPDTHFGVEVVDLVVVENTLGSYGGTVMPIEEMRGIAKVAHDQGTPVHLDGARIWNASAASGIPVTEYTAEADTVMFCVSKGLGAPIGSLLCGPADLMPEARRLKILYGGAWRQAGIVAAAGLIALQVGPGRLPEDHARARRLAEGIEECLPGSVDLPLVETNIVYADPAPAGLEPLRAIDRLQEHGVGATFVAGRVRMVTHVDIDDDDIETAIAAWRDIAATTA